MAAASVSSSPARSTVASPARRCDRLRVWAPVLWPETLLARSDRASASLAAGGAQRSMSSTLKDWLLRIKLHEEDVETVLSFLVVERINSVENLAAAVSDSDDLAVLLSELHLLLASKLALGRLERGLAALAKQQQASPPSTPKRPPPPPPSQQQQPSSPASEAEEHTPPLPLPPSKTAQARGTTARKASRALFAAEPQPELSEAAAATRLQAAARRWAAQRWQPQPVTSRLPSPGELEFASRAVLTLQAQARGVLARWRLADAVWAATRIQAAARGRRTWLRYDDDLYSLRKARLRRDPIYNFYSYYWPLECFNRESRHDYLLGSGQRACQALLERAQWLEQLERYDVAEWFWRPRVAWAPLPYPVVPVAPAGSRPSHDLGTVAELYQNYQQRARLCLAAGYTPPVASRSNESIAGRDADCSSIPQTTASAPTPSASDRQPDRQSPLCSCEPSLAGAPTSTASRPLWKLRPGAKPDAHLPYEFRLPLKEFQTLELYDAWLRGESLCGDGDMYHDDEWFHSGLDYDPRTPAQRVLFRLHRTLAPLSCIHSFSIDTRCPASSQRAAFAEHGWPEGPPTTGHIMRAMVRQVEESARMNALFEGRKLQSYPKTLVAYFGASASGESGLGVVHYDQDDVHEPWTWDETDGELDEPADDEAHTAGGA